MKTYDVSLTTDELLLIDGKVSKKAQEVIEKAKQEKSVGFDIDLLNEVIVASTKRGRLTWTFKQIRHCDFCDKKRKYAGYTRTTRWHTKGDPNYDRPIYYGGVAFNQGFITIKGRGDMCQSCFSKMEVLKKLIDYILDNDLKIEIQKNDYKDTRYKVDDLRICYQCKKEMYESEMGRRHALMGQGTYPSECPHCGAKSIPFGRSHEVTTKHRMIKVEENGK